MADTLDAFAAEIFALFDARTRVVYLRGGKTKRNALLQFARLIAAYYLDFGTPPSLWSDADTVSELRGVTLPNLLVWAESAANNEDNDAFARAFPRDAFAAMPAELTPGVVTELLCACGAWLEAIFFVDHFADFRAQILLRRVVDNAFALELFTEHCKRCLLESLMTRLCGNKNISETQLLNVSVRDAPPLIALISRHVDVLTQLDVVFATELVACLKHDAMRQIDMALTRLQDDDVDKRVRLPRPPIYATPSEFDSTLTEVRAWNSVHYLIQLLLACLARANHLETLIATLVTWILRAQQSDDNESELPYLIEGELYHDGVPDEDIQLFAKMTFCVLQMNLRDRISLFWRRHNSLEVDNNTLINSLDESAFKEFALLERKYYALFKSYYEEDGTRHDDSDDNSTEKKDTLSTQLLRRWMHFTMDTDDVALLMNFLQFAKATHPQTEKYLPSLSEASASKWRATLLSQVSTRRNVRASETTDDDVVHISNFDKVLVDTLEMQRLLFLADVMPSIILFDNGDNDGVPLINISLRLCVETFARCSDIANANVMKDVNDWPVTESNTQIMPGSICEEKRLTAEAGNTIAPTNDLLLANIRASIRRLNRMHANSTREPQDTRLMHSENLVSYGRCRQAPSKTVEREFDNLLVNFQMELLHAEISEHRTLLKEFIATKRQDLTNNKFASSRTARSAYQRERNDKKRSTTTLKTTTSRSLPAKFKKTDEKPNKYTRDLSQEINNKVSSQPKNQAKNDSRMSTSQDSQSQKKSSHKMSTRRSHCVEVMSTHLTPSTSSRGSSGRYSDVSMSSERLRAEIDDIGQRLSRLRDELRIEHSNPIDSVEVTPSPFNSVCCNELEESGLAINTASGYLSDDSAIAPSTPLSAHGIVPLDFSTLHSSGDESPKRKWTEIEIFPRPRRNVTASHEQQQATDKTTKQAEDRKIKQEHLSSVEENHANKLPEALPTWLRLLPSKRQFEVDAKNDEEALAGEISNEYGTRPLLQLPRYMAPKENGKNTHNQRKSAEESSSSGRYMACEDTEVGISKTGQQNGALLFSSEMTLADIEAIRRLVDNNS